MKQNLILQLNGFKLLNYGHRHKVPIRIIYTVLALLIPFVVPVIIAPFIPKTIYINGGLK